MNEELHTVNAEYQIKILELTEMTNDLENLMAATRIGTLFLDENLEIRKFTPELKRVYRILEGDIGRPVSHLTHNLAGVDPPEMIRQVVSTGDPLEVEVKTPEGEWFLMRVLPYQVGASEVSGVVLTFTDIGGRKKTQEALAVSESRFQDLFSTMRDGYALHEIILDDDGNPTDYRFLAVNPAFERLTGLNSRDIIGKRVLDILPGTERHWIETYGHVAITGEPLMYENYSGEINKFFEVYAFSPGKGRFACVFQDVTERRRAGEKTAMLLEILNETQELTKVGGWMWDLEKQEMFWTAEAYRIHGYDPEAIPPGASEHIERSIECYDEADRPVIQEKFRLCCEKGEPYDMEFNFTDIHGKRMRIRTAAHAIMECDKIIRVIGNLMDITPEKKDKKGGPKGAGRGKSKKESCE